VSDRGDRYGPMEWAQKQMERNEREVRMGKNGDENGGKIVDERKEI